MRALGRWLGWWAIATVLVAIAVSCSSSVPATEIEFFRALESPVERGTAITLEWRVMHAGSRTGFVGCALRRRMGEAAWGDAVEVPCEGSLVEVPDAPADAASVSYRLRVLNNPFDPDEPYVIRDVLVRFVVPTVAVTPAEVALDQGGDVAFTAEVAGAVDTAVTWSASKGAIDGSGSTVTYTAPMEAGSFVVTATSVADPRASASASVVVAGVEVRVDPPTASVLVDSTVELTATVTGTTVTDVAWDASCGSILGSGSTVTFVAPSFVGTCTVTATSTSDPSASAEVTVTVGEVVVSIAPASVAMDQGETRLFTATVSGADDTSVTWSSTGGTWSGTGNSVTFTAPMEAGSFVVTATSVAAPDVHASATVSVPEAVIDVSPREATLLDGEQQVFTVSLSGVADLAVAWTATSGSLAGSGTEVTYTAPTVPGAYTVTVTSVAKPSVSASAAVSVERVEVTLAPASVELYTDETATFTATVSGTSEDGVAWSASCGSIRGTGPTVTYLPPSFDASCGVTATSARDPRRSASATVEVAVRPTGDVLWTAEFGTMQADRVHDVAVDAVGNVFIGGTVAWPASERDLFVAKYSREGARLWTWNRGTSAEDRLFLVAPQADGAVVVAGATDGSFSSAPTQMGNLFLLEVSADGLRTETVVEFGTPEMAYAAADMEFDGDGNLLVVGSTYPAESFFESHRVLAKYEADGTERWLVDYAPMEPYFPGEMAVDAAGSAVIAGAYFGKATFVAKVDRAGDPVFRIHPGFGEYDTGNDVEADAQGAIYLVGSTYVPDRAYVAKFDPLGEELWRDYPVSDAEALAVAVDASRGIVVAGGPLRYATPGRLFAARYDLEGTASWIRSFGPLGASAVEMHIDVDALGTTVVAATVPRLLDDRPDPDGSGYDVLIVRLAR